MQYFEQCGTYAVAYEDVFLHGGQLYQGNGKDSANVVVRGNNCTTYWTKGSKRKQEVEEVCKFLNIDSYAMTGGRICRWLVGTLLAVPYKETFWQKRYLGLAKSGKHWHYCHVQPWKSFLGIEVDLKSAYFSSLFAGKSLLYQDGKGYLPDNGALEYLKELTPFLPKWLRLQFLGTLASWQTFFWIRDKKNSDNKELLRRTRANREYRAAFNCAHRAILRNYKIMERLHCLGGEWIRRMHTDSFTLDCAIPRDREESIWRYLEEKNVEYDIKRAGECFFFDLNLGFVGRIPIGSKVELKESLKESGVRMARQPDYEWVLNRFGDLLEKSSFDILGQKKKQETPLPTSLQGSLFDTKLYEKRALPQILGE